MLRPSSSSCGPGQGKTCWQLIAARVLIVTVTRSIKAWGFQFPVLCPAPWVRSKIFPHIYWKDSHDWGLDSQRWSIPGRWNFLYRSTPVTSVLAQRSKAVTTFGCYASPAVDAPAFRFRGSSDWKFLPISSRSFFFFWLHLLYRML